YERPTMRGVTTIRPWLGGVGETFREFFLLTQAERKSATLAGAQLDSVRPYAEAARRRLSTAQGLRDPGELCVALSLYRSAALLQTAAFLVSGDRTLEFERLTPEDLLERLGGALDGDGHAAMDSESLRTGLTVSEPLVL